MPTIAERVQALEDWKAAAQQKFIDLRGELGQAEERLRTVLQELKQQVAKEERNIRVEVRRKRTGR